MANSIPTKKNPLRVNASLNPLWMISLFLSFTETMLGFAVVKTQGYIQASLTCFVILFPIAISAGFFVILWRKPWAFYAPGEFVHGATISEYVLGMSGSLHKVQRPLQTIYNCIDCLKDPRYADDLTKRSDLLRTMEAAIESTKTALNADSIEDGVKTQSSK